MLSILSSKITLNLRFLYINYLFIVVCMGNITNLSKSNFETTVLEDQDPWVIGISTRVSLQHFDKLRLELRGFAKVGIINFKEYVDFLQELDAPSYAFIFENIRVYPFGQKIHKLRKWKNVQDFEKAKKEALSSIPDTTTQLPSIIQGKNEALRGFIETAYGHLPPRFPVILFTGEDSSSTVDYRNAALKFPSLFHFGVVKDPPFETLSIYRLTKIPSLLILLAEVLSDGTPRVRPILYDEKPNGPLKYPNIVRFFYLVHKKYFKELPGSDNPAINLDVDDIFEQHFKEFPETLQPPNIQNKQINNGENKNKEDKNIDKDIDKERTSIVEDISEESPIKSCYRETKHAKQPPCSITDTDVCILILLKLADSQDIDKHKLVNLEKQLKSTGKTTELHTLSMDCNMELISDFDINEDDLPAVLVTLPKKKVFAYSTLAGRSKIDNLRDFISKVLTANAPFRKYNKMSKIKTCQCKDEIRRREDISQSRYNTKHKKTEL